ncbi:MDR family MFS transporter [Streptomyces asiaticus]
MEETGQAPRLVAGRYRLREVLGQGGMGVVWRATDELIGRTVAVKELRAPHGLSEEERAVFSERALREARTAGQVSHPGVVAIYDLVPVTPADSAVYIVMELVEAPSLAELLQRDGSLPEQRVAQLGLRALKALNAAHAIGLVHRDVKPSNILVLPDDDVKLVDFGIAHAVDETRLTRHGVAGSTGYMAPELFAGRAPSPAVDLWSLGATLFHALKGVGPFDRTSTAATLHAILYDDLPPLDDHPLLAPVITGLLVRDDTQRTTSRQAEALLHTAAGAPPLARSDRDRVSRLTPRRTETAGEGAGATWEVHSTRVRRTDSPGARREAGPVSGSSAASWESHPTTVRSSPPRTPPRRTPRQARYVRWTPLALAVLAVGHLTVMASNSVVVFSLGTIGRDLGVSPSAMTWVSDAYALTFVGLLLLAGRAADVFGRRLILRAGIALFTLASLAGGLAPSEGLLLIARLLQGAGAAAVVPSVLALITTTFPDGRARTFALGVFAAVSVTGSMIGLLLGGLMHDHGTRWQLLFLANVPLGLVVLVGTMCLVETERRQGRLDAWPAVTGAGGMLALTHGIIRGGQEGWTEGFVLASFAVAVALLVAFLVIQARAAHPMMPIRLYSDPRRSGNYLAMALFSAISAVPSFYYQRDSKTGDFPSFIACALVITLVLGVAAGAKLTNRVTPGKLVWTALLVGVSGLIIRQPGILALPLGLGVLIAPSILAATRGVDDEDAGSAGAVLTTAQQIASALTVALL